MTMNQSVTVLDATQMTSVLAPQVADWCQANPPGYVLVGDWHTGTDPASLTYGYARAQATGWAVLAECYRRGVECRIGWGLGLHVLQPQGGSGAPRGRRAPGLTSDWLCRSSVAWSTALDSWPDEWRFSVASTLDPEWWNGNLAGIPTVMGYVANRDLTAHTMGATGLLAQFWRDDYRAWLLDHAQHIKDTVLLDWWLVSVKPWMQAGWPYLTPAAPDTPSSLIQPPTMTVPQWTSGISFLLTGLSAIAPVVTQTRPFRTPEQMGLGGTAVEVVVGESVMGSLA